MTTPNNSDQAAMHDELRASHAEVLRELLHLSKGLFPLEKLAIKAAIAALTLPASEAAAWRLVQPSLGEFGVRNWREMPAPDADFLAECAKVGERIEYAYTHPSPMPVDALRELEASYRRQAAEWSRNENIYVMATANGFTKAADELTALLSGGAAREDDNG